MATRILKITPPGRYITHEDWEQLGLSFKRIVHGGSEYIQADGVLQNGIKWYNQIVAMPGVSIEIYTTEQLQAKKDQLERAGLEQEIPLLRTELTAKETRLTELGGDPGTL